MTRFTIGKLAKACDVKIDTVRHYEQLGLLKVQYRTEAGYRIYDSEAINRICFIKKTQCLGFKLQEIKELLALKSSNKKSCAEVYKKTGTKIKQVQDKIHELQNMEQALKALAKQCSAQGQQGECHILDISFLTKKGKISG